MKKFFCRTGVGVWVFCLAVGCETDYTIQEFLNKTATDVELNKKIESGEYLLKCNYKPAELIAIEEIMKGSGINKKVTKEIFNKELSMFGQALYFDFTVSMKDNSSVLKKNVTNEQEYTAFLSELTYNMGRDVCLVKDGKDTIRPLTYNYSNSYGMAPDIRLLFAFSKKAMVDADELEFNYSDKIFGINDKIKFSYKTKSLSQKNNINFN